MHMHSISESIMTDFVLNLFMFISLMFLLILADHPFSQDQSLLDDQVDYLMSPFGL